MKNHIFKAIILWLFIISVMVELCVVSNSVLLYFIWTSINVYLFTLVNHIPYEDVKRYLGYTFMEKQMPELFQDKD